MTLTSFSITGFAFLATSSRRVSARLEHAGHEGEAWVRIIAQDESEEELARSPLRAVQIDAALGRADRKLTFEDGTVFETADHEGFQKIEGQTHGARLHRLERFGPHLIGFAIACLAAAYVLWRYGLDLLAALAVAATPQIVVEQIDRGTLRTLDLVMAEPTTLMKDDQARVRVIYERVVDALPQSEKDARSFTLLFRDLPNAGPNAFALPGGTMVMTDDLVRAFPDENVLAGILGHEIGHVVEEHGLRRLYRSLGAYVLIAFLAGETGPLMEDLLLEGNALLALSYGRKQETSADRFGLALSHDAGFDPSGLKVFFKKLSEKTGDEPQWSSTHPSHDKRIDAIEAFIDDLPAR